MATSENVVKLEIDKMRADVRKIIQDYKVKLENNLKLEIDQTRTAVHKVIQDYKTKVENSKNVLPINLYNLHLEMVQGLQEGIEDVLENPMVGFKDEEDNENEKIPTLVVKLATNRFLDYAIEPTKEMIANHLKVLNESVLVIEKHKPLSQPSTDLFMKDFKSLQEKQKKIFERYFGEVVLMRFGWELAKEFTPKDNCEKHSDTVKNLIMVEKVVEKIGANRTLIFTKDVTVNLKSLQPLDTVCQDILDCKDKANQNKSKVECKRNS